MNRKEEILFRLKCGEKAYFRGGSVLKNILLKKDTMISGAEALLIFNTYGISPALLKLFLYSHGKEMHDEDFSDLLIQQEEQVKNRRQCKTTNNSDDK